MRTTRGLILGSGLVFGIMLGAPVVLSGVDAPAATAVVSLFVDDAAAQDESITGTCTVGNPNCIAADSGAGGGGGDATSSTGDGARGGRGGNGNGGLALLHEVITTSATSDTALSANDLQTGDIHHEMTILVEDTDETVVINNAGSPGSTGIHLQNVGAASHAVNTGSNNGSADASGDGGDGGNGGDSGDGGDALSIGGTGGTTILDDVIQALG